MIGDAPLQFFRKRFLTLYHAVPAPMRGIGLMMLASLGVVGMTVSIRHVADDVHPFVIAFLRHVIGVMLLMPFMLPRTANPLRTQRLPLHGLRAFLNVVAMLAYFLALTLEPLAKVVALTFTAPLLATIAAILFLGERITPARGGTLLLGLVGALIILRPWSVDISFGSMLLLFSSMTWGVALVVIKMLARTETPVTITIYASLLQIPFAFVAALFFWSWPSLHDFGYIILVALFGCCTQISLSQAFREADATVVLPADFTKLIFAGLAGWYFFSELPEIWIWVGGAVVFTGVILNAWFDKQMRSRTHRAAGDDNPPQRR